MAKKVSTKEIDLEIINFDTKKEVKNKYIKRVWLKYTGALAEEVLGYVGGKYDTASINIPGGISISVPIQNVDLRKELGEVTLEFAIKAHRGVDKPSDIDEQGYGTIRVYNAQTKETQYVKVAQFIKLAVSKGAKVVDKTWKIEDKIAQLNKLKG